jgi:hypothetical protein
VSFNGTSVGLDVHALSVVAHALSAQRARGRQVDVGDEAAAVNRRT